MNKLKSSVYLLCRFPLFNPEAVPQFEQFDKENSILLYSTLLLNFKEIFDNNDDLPGLHLIMDTLDREFLPPELTSYSILWYNSEEKGLLFSYLANRIFPECEFNLLITSDSIGTSERDVKKVFELLSMEDHAVVIGKTINDKASFVGFNSFDHELFTEYNWNDLSYDKSLIAACRENAHVHVLENILVIENLNDFRLLYDELSKKESLAYCSQEMHERFTHLFIEYKDLLK